MIKVSVITVSYNSAKTIRKTLESVVNQTYKNIEYIIIDGASNDGTVDIIKEYAENYSFIKYVSEKDNGIYDAMNKGLKIATGDIIGIVNSDDYYEVDAVECVVNNVPKSDTFVVYGMVRMIRDGMEESVSIYSPEFINERMMLHPACFVSKTVYDKYGIFDGKYRIAADYDLFLRFIQHRDICFAPVYKILSNFSCEGISNSKDAIRENFKVRYDHNCITKKAYITFLVKFYLRKLICN